MAPVPRISVLLPLQDGREAGVQCVKAWAGQEVNPRSFELVALAPGEDHALERSVRPLLRQHDRWIVAPGMDEYELFNLGATEGKGDFVFVTEAHCVPEPGCLRAMLDELDRTGAPGIRGTSVPLARGPLGDLESDAFEDALKVEEDPAHWRKVLIHSLAIRRDLYLDVGGLPAVYGDFAPWPLAIALHSRGERLVYSARPRVTHVYDGDLRQLGSHVRSFGRGEMRFRSEAPAGTGDRYLDPAVEWEQRLGHTRAGARRAVRAAIALRRRDGAREAARHAAVAIFGARLSIVNARLGSAAAARRARSARDPESRRNAFREFWRLASRRGRLEGLAKARLGEAPPSPAAARLDLSRSLAGRAIGFFHLESADGAGPFRWTAPLALIKVDVPAAAQRARLELLPMERPHLAPEPRPTVAIDGRVVSASIGKDTIEFGIAPGVHWIAVASSPFRPRQHGVDDPRSLGLPVRGLTFHPST